MRKIIFLLAILLCINIFPTAAEEEADYYAQGMQHAIDGQFREAKEAFAKVLDSGEMYDTMVSYIKIIDDALEGKVKKEAAVYLFESFIYADNGYDEPARQYAEEAVRIDPNYALSYNALGAQYNNVGRYDEGIAILEKALEFDSGIPMAYNNLGYAYKRKKEYDKAISYLKKGIEFDPKSNALYGNLGSTYNSKGDYDAAIEAYRMAISLDSMDARAYNNIAISYYMKKDFTKAIEYCDKAIKLGYPVKEYFLEELASYR